MSWGVGQYQPHDTDTDTDRHARGNKKRYSTTTTTSQADNKPNLAQSIIPSFISNELTQTIAIYMTY